MTTNLKLIRQTFLLLFSLVISINANADSYGFTVNIGQEAPLGDGLYILIAGCIVLGTIKILKREIESYYDKQ